MKPSTKAKVISKLNEIKTIIEKCGGAGGTPGPCPEGGLPRLPIDAKQSKKAIEASETANKLSMVAGGNISKNLSAKALDYARHQEHSKASEFHYLAAEKHRQTSEDVLPGNPQKSKQHQDAAKAHMRAGRENGGAVPKLDPSQSNPSLLDTARNRLNRQNKLDNL